ncbi:DUF1648 domain-containing protein [Vagococcus silagei]|uniref:DUF1648 domain-containing protein n=1 Tax=Vagococcus silagei TaxID=2508885 RepID=A0A4S3B7C1_9ENTE|nr:DUF1648 domain-containing protein [Vagococcus silagei]THB61753.1 DUF1648 domain-containing protein [Vagococcus silagei]
MNASVILLMGIILLLVNVSLAFTPRVSRRSNLFGITIPGALQEHEDIQKFRHHFTIIMLLANIFILFPIVPIIAVASPDKLIEMSPIYLALGMIANFALFLVLYFDTRRKLVVLMMKNSNTLDETSKKVIVDPNFRDQKFIFPTSYFVGINLVFVIFSIIYTMLVYDKIPQQIPTNFDAAMNPVVFSEKSFKTVFFAPMMQVFLTILFGVTNQAIYKAKQQLATNHSEQYSQNDRRFRKSSSLGMLTISLLIQVLFVGVQLITITPNSNPFIILPLVIIVLIGTFGINLFIGFKYRQNGEELTPDINFEMPQDDANWKLGGIYYNKKDPSVWVMKKSGLGLTLNMARWETWLFLVTIIVGPLIFTFFMMN